MLEQKDYDVLKNMMESVVSRSGAAILEKVDERITDTENRLLEKVDERITDTENRLLEEMDERISTSENLLLEEMERTRSILDNKISKVQKNLDELAQYYRITKLENDNTALLLKLIDELARRVEELERKTA